MTASVISWLRCAGKQCMATARGAMDPALYDVQIVELRLSIDANGEVRDAVVTNPSPERESAEHALVSALKRSRFRPVITDGAAVASTDQVYREPVYVKRPKVK